MTGKIWIKTLRQALELIFESIESNRILVVDEIMDTLECSSSNAYNYWRFLRQILPHGRFDDDRPVRGIQRRLRP
jgi:hypothetical protein